MGGELRNHLLKESLHTCGMTFLRKNNGLGGRHGKGVIFRVVINVTRRRLSTEPFQQITFIDPAK